jgi:type IV pilus assembly protein PilY1
VFVTDGLPSNDENGNPGSASSLMPGVVSKLNSLRSLTATVSGGSYTFDVETFVVGVGLTTTDKILLDSMAVAGGTDAGGHAYYADNPTQLQTALGQIFYQIYENSYSFSVTSVSSTRTTNENYTYQASFEPVNADPFWRGHLGKFSINSDGSIGSMIWDAGAMLQATPATARNVLTYLSGSMTKFAAPQNGGLDWGQWKNYLMVDTHTAKTIIPYILGDPSFNPDNWKLGDTIHSNPISIGAPSSYFIDVLSPNGFSTFRMNNQNRQRIIVIGSNDGQFRAFNGSNGNEQWSFVPPNLLPKLQYISHSSYPILPPESHQYFVDGPVIGADVWLGAGDGTSKFSSDWKTLVVFSEGRGVRNSTNTQASYLWSSSQYCDGNFNYQYTSTYKYYCGYWAFDVTNTSATTPNLIWRINPNATTGPYLDEPWGKMAIGRVKINGNEKWVGFIGAGYNNDGDPNRGKGFFVVDLSNGNILWGYTRGNDASMAYSIPASPAIVDTDNDGFVDTAYIGDLGGNIWRFNLCTGAGGNACGISNWSGGKLFQSSTATPIFTTPSAARGSDSSIWVFWGTGDKQNPTALGTQDSFFAVKDSDRTSTYTLSQLVNITNSIFSDNGAGWYITLASGEKVLADCAVFGGFISWTTYSSSTSGNLCNNAGSAKLYAVAMMPVSIGAVKYVPGAGLFETSTGNEVGTRSVALGAGIAQVPLFSQKPSGSGATDLFVTTSGGADQSSSIVTSAGLADSPFKSRLQMTAPSGQLLHWRDQRMH